jgi:FixJ family two-component response regulator
VAIVDDDEAIRGALARLIRTLGYASRTFASAEALLAVADATDIACVLTDVQMPGMNGLDLVKELRRRGHVFPAMVMTAYPSLTNRELALAAGALEYSSKPLDDALLERWLLSAMGGSHAA